MRNRTIKALLSLTVIAAVATPGVAQARHGADDPAGHVRHATHAKKHHKHHKHHEAERNHRGGAYDGPNHS